jgi:hypothetical protein
MATNGVEDNTPGSNFAKADVILRRFFALLQISDGLRQVAQYKLLNKLARAKAQWAILRRIGITGPNSSPLKEI